MRKDLNNLTLFSCKKVMIFLTFLFIFLSYPIFAEQLLTKWEILRVSNECFKDFHYDVCNKLFLEMEKIQFFESEQNRYKCQASILGLQTELIEAYYFQKSKKNKKVIMIPYVIKNC